MRVALVGPYPVEPGCVRGGVEAANYCLSQGLRKIDGLDLHIVVPTKLIQSDRRVLEDPVTIHYLRKPRVRLVPNMLTAIGRIRRKLDEIQPDVVHGQDPCGTVAAVRAGYPVVHTIHAVVHKEARYYGASLSVRLNMALFNRIVRSAISGASHLVPVSSYVAREYADIARSEVTVIPNAVDDRFFRLRGDAVPGRLLYVGFVRPGKNILGLVRAMRMVVSEHPGAQLVVAGGISDPGYHAQVLDYIKAQGLGESVRFAGQLDQDELERQHAEAEVVCIFSSHETFSLTVAQGMAAGKPVVSTDSGGPSDLISDGQTGFLVAVGDEAAFADRCCRLLSSSELRDSMGRKAREIARQRYTKEAVAESTYRVYQRLLEQRAPAIARSVQ